MEEEINYSTVVFKNDVPPPKEKKEEPAIYSEVKPRVPATTAQTFSSQADGEAATRSDFRVLAVCLGILLVVSVSTIVYISVVMAGQKANLRDLTAANQQLTVEKSISERETEELRRVTDNLNRTLGVILKFSTFPVNEYCQEKQCQPCRTDWIRFQEKCYLFYNEEAPWKTWGESQRYCQDRNADLVVIDSLQEQEFISNHTAYYYDSEHGYWLGLSETEDKKWFWVDGRLDTLMYWMKDPLGNTGPYALMIPGKHTTASWDPAEHDMENKFICESEALIWLI